MSLSGNLKRNEVLDYQYDIEYVMSNVIKFWNFWQL